MLLQTYGGLDVSATMALRSGLEAANAERSSNGIPIRRHLATFHRRNASVLERSYLQLALAYFWRGPFPGIYRRAFGLEPMLLLDLSKFRSQASQPTGTYVPWHLDANFYGFDVPLMTIWIPFQDVGSNAPGLEFCLPTGSITDDTIRDFWSEICPDENGSRSIPDHAIEDMFGSEARRVAPVLPLGGCFIFDQYVLHRTQILPGATKPRLALEFRVSAADRAPNRWYGASSPETLGVRYDPHTEEISIQHLGHLFPSTAVDTR